MPLPDFADRSLIRTDFSDQAAWERVRDAAMAPSEDDFMANLDEVNERVFTDATPEAILEAAAANGAGLVFVVDTTALMDPDHPILVLGPGQDPDRFRVVPSSSWSVENNLFWNMNWEEFADAAGPDGVFRGF